MTPGAEDDPAVMARGPADCIDPEFTPEIAGMYDDSTDDDEDGTP